jgi:L-malate glycosyltransferase
MSEFAIGLLTNEDLLAKMKQQAFEHAQEFDIQNIVPQYEKLYSRFCRLEPCL